MSACKRCDLHLHNQPANTHLNSVSSSNLGSHPVSPRWSLEAPRCLYICGGGLFIGCRAGAKAFSFTLAFNDQRLVAVRLDPVARRQRKTTFYTHTVAFSLPGALEL